MKKSAVGAALLSCVVAVSAFSATSVTLNNVSYQITEQQWVKSSQATATIAINATVSGQNVATLRESMMKNLQQIAQGSWHIIQFSRVKTSSGLESVKALAQIRLAAGALTSIYERVKTVSKAGQTYTVSSLDFNPDVDDIVAAQATLRQKIYADVQSELKKLNQQFSNANYFVHDINFTSPNAVAPRAYALARVQGSAALPNVSQKLTMQANVVLSSKIKETGNGS